MTSSGILTRRWPNRRDRHVEDHDPASAANRGLFALLAMCPVLASLLWWQWRTDTTADALVDTLTWAGGITIVGGGLVALLAGRVESFATGQQWLVRSLIFSTVASGIVLLFVAVLVEWVYFQANLA